VLKKHAKPMSRSALWSDIHESDWMIHEPALHAYINRLGTDPQLAVAFEDGAKNIFGIIRELTPEKSKAEQMSVENGTAFLQVKGVLSPTWNWVSALFGDTTLDILTSNFQEAIDDKRVKNIVLLVDSPGGRAKGNDDISQLIYESREKKNIVTFADGLMGSAAYYIGSAASQIYATKTSTIGSIGSILVHVEISKAAEEAGVKFTPIFFGKHKADGNPYEKLSPQSRASLQQIIDDHGQMFVDAVARNRGITSSQVRSRYGDGQAFLSPRALEQGLIDEILSVGELQSAISSKSRSKPMSESNEAAVTTEQFQALLESQKTQGKQIDQLTAGMTSIVDAMKQQQARDDKTQRAADIAALCKMAGVADKSAEYIADENLSANDVRDKLFTDMCNNRKPDAGDGGGSDTSGGDNKESKYRREYRENKRIHEELGVTEDEYVEQCKIENGDEPDPMDKPAAPFFEIVTPKQQGAA